MVPHTCCHTRSNHSTFSTTMSEQTTSGKRQDDEDFGRYYGVTGKRICYIRVAHQHVERNACHQFAKDE
ncbi:hypothetical protein YC2023_109229 [Brassica napus]